MLLTEITPQDLALPARYKKWRPGQLEAIYKTAESSTKFVAHAMPTGSGKSVFAIACSILFGGRTGVLTSTKALQDQYTGEFAECGMVDVRGANNYRCHGGFDSCGEGRMMGCKADNCPRSIAVDTAKRSSLMVTNYDCFLHSYLHGDGLGEFDLLFCDEGHQVMEELCGVMEVVLDHNKAYQVYNTLSLIPPIGSTMAEWQQWAVKAAISVGLHLDEMKHHHAGPPYLRILSELKFGLARIAIADPKDWIVEEAHDRSKFSVVWPTKQAESLLFSKAKKVVFLSATIVEKSLELLNVVGKDLLFCYQDYQFDARRCPVYLFGPSRIDFHASEGQIIEWVARMDMLISKRLDRKGIIHTVSYKNQEAIVSRSHDSSIMTAPRSHNLGYLMNQFKKAPPPQVLVTPSVTTGYDFPGPECEYQIIAKVPFIDTRSAVMQARIEKDKDYTPYLTAQTLVQTCGRAMRSEKDQCENFILDSHANWFVNRYRKLLPYWFRNLLQFPEYPPLPPPPLPPDWKA